MHLWKTIREHVLKVSLATLFTSASSLFVLVLLIQSGLGTLASIEIQLILYTLCTITGNQINLYFSTRYFEENQFNYYILLIISNMVLGGVIVASLSVVSHLILFNPVQAAGYLVIVPIAVTRVCYSGLLDYLRYCEKFSSYALLQTVDGLVKLLAAVIFFVLGFDWEQCYFYYLIGVAPIAILLLCVKIKWTPFQVVQTAIPQFKTLGAFLFSRFFASGSTYCLENLPRSTLIFQAAPTTLLGTYAVCRRIANVTKPFTAVANVILQPAIVKTTRKSMKPTTLLKVTVRQLVVVAFVLLIVGYATEHFSGNYAIAIFSIILVAGNYYGAISILQESSILVLGNNRATINRVAGLFVACITIVLGAVIDPTAFYFIILSIPLGKLFTSFLMSN